MPEARVELHARIATMGDLDEILGAMRGIAAACVQQGDAARSTMRGFTRIVTAALDGALGVPGTAEPFADAGPGGRRAVIAFCAEHGFVGGLNENVLRAAAAVPQPMELFVVGTRGRAVAEELGLTFSFAAAMSTRAAGLGEVADQIAEVLLRRFSGGEIGRLDVVSARRAPGGQVVVERSALLPLERPAPQVVAALPPLATLPASELVARLAEEYLYARLAEHAAESFAAENAARLAILQSAHAHLEDMLQDLRAAEHRLRQEEITAEVLELVAGRKE